jgi:hypothetical protein
MDYPAEDSSVNSVITALVGLESERILGTDEVELEAYALDDPEIRVSLMTEDGASRSLAVGSEAALGSNRAFRRNEDPAIILGRGWIVTDLDRDLDGWRSKDVIDISSVDVTALNLTTGADTVQAVREGQRWRLTVPLEDLADTSHVDSLLNDLNSLRVEEFVAEDADPAELGLQEPTTTVSLVVTGEDDPVTLEFGASREQSGATQVACRRNDSSLFWVTDAAATRLAKAPVTWRAPRVWDFETWDAERLTISDGATSVELVRSQGLWESGDERQVDHGEVQDRLSTLAELEAVEFDLIQPGTDVMGSVELTVSGQGEGETSAASFVFYAPMAEGGDTMVTVSGRETVMSVSTDSVEKLLADPTNLFEPEQTVNEDGAE